jgi:hypothetical protein
MADRSTPNEGFTCGKNFIKEYIDKIINNSAGMLRSAKYAA